MPDSSQTSGTIEEILFKKGLLTKDQLSLVRLETINTGASAEKVILDHQMVTEEQIAEGKSSLLGLPYIKLEGKTISPEILSLIPESIARRYNLIPFEKQDNSLLVAMIDPLDLQVVEFIETKSGMQIKPYLGTLTDILKAINEQYAKSLSAEVSAALKEVGKPVVAEETVSDVAKIPQIIREAPVAKIVSTLLEYGIKVRASDIHIEPLEEKTRVRFRIDGILQEKLILPQKVHEAVISRVKILSDMKIDEKRIPQDGRFTFKIGEEEIDLRVSTLPTAHGEKVVMRLLKKTGGVPTLADLGLRGTALKNLETQLQRPHGIILVCGPTGSGKTTTLYSILSKINSTKVNIITLEDPVEYKIAGVNQVQVNPAAGLTFASGLRSFLRQDPNIMMVGEIRDTETAELAIQAALTGHLMFSSLHTNTAAGALPRLLDMEAEPYLIASTVNAIAGQRVVRRVCLSCKESYGPPKEVVEQIRQALGKLFPQKTDKKSQTAIKLYRGKGCQECSNTGYSGRIGIFEVLPISEKIARLVLERAPSSEIEEQAVAEGMVTMTQDGFLKVLEGITTIEEVLRVSEE